MVIWSMIAMCTLLEIGKICLILCNMKCKEFL